LLMNRSSASAAGLGFGGNRDANGQAELAYNWNNNSDAWGFHSGLFAPLNTWSFVALTITPTNATLYLCYTNGDGTGNVFKRVNTLAHSLETFNAGTTWLGGDPANINNIFSGSIDEVAVFSRSFSDAQIQNLFVAGAGTIGAAPSITSDISCNTATNQYVGQVPLQVTAAGIGLPAPHYQWQAGTGGVFTDLANGGAISGVNSGTLTIDPATTANNLEYRLVLTNVNGSATSSVYTVTLVSVPNNGIWTACYQVTNNGNASWAWGSGSYTGHGVLSAGGFWNPVPTSGEWGSGTFTSVSDYLDNGSTHSGITCTIRGTCLSGGGTVYPSSDRRTLLSQMVAVYGSSANTIVLTGVPNGTYNLAFYGTDGQWCDRGATFTVHAANGDITAATANNGAFQYFVAGDNAVIKTNVAVSGGTLNVDMTPTTPVPQHDPNGEGYVNAIEVQLVQAVGNPANITGMTVSGGNVVITGTCPDIGQSYRILTSTNLALPVSEWVPVATNTFAGGAFTIRIPLQSASPQQFYRVAEP